MLLGSVTSRASTRRRSERGRTSSRGVRIVAMTFQSRSRKYRAVSRPNPDEHPVIRATGLSCTIISLYCIIRNNVPAVSVKYGTLFRLSRGDWVNDEQED